jgi:hypothetical protein
LKSKREKLDQIQEQRDQINNRVTRKSIMPTGGSNKNLPVSDYFVRLRTTSCHTDKYAETIDILLNLLLQEQENNQRSGSDFSTIIR